MTEFLMPRGYSQSAPRLWALTLLCAACLAVPVAYAQGTDRDELNEQLERAETALRDNQYRTAAEAYLAAAELSDESDVAQTATRVAYTYGFNELGVEAAERWLDVAEDSDEALLYAAQLHLRTGDIGDSHRYFSRLIKQGEGPPEERLLSLVPILAEENADDANRLMRRLARPYRRTGYGQYATAVMALQAGQADDAEKFAQRAIELEPEWIKPKLLFARALMLGGDDEGAIDYAARIVGDDPQPDPEARLELAIMYLSVGRDDDALSQVNQVLLEQPSRTDALRMLAIINYRLGNLDAAWADFQDLLSSGRYTMDALFYLAQIADRREEYARAIGLYTQVSDGQNVVPAQRRASALITQEADVETALNHLRSFAEQHPNHAVEMVAVQAQLLASKDRNEEALDVYDQVMRFRPDAEGVLLGRAELLVRMDRIDEAIEQYEAALDRYPDSANSLNALGYTLADRTTDYKQARRLIRKAMKLEPNNPAIIDSWGWVQYRMGNYEEALEHLERAYADYRDAEVAAHIVEVLWKMERHDEALERLETAEAEAPGHPLLESIRERAFPDAPQPD